MSMRLNPVFALLRRDFIAYRHQYRISTGLCSRSMRINFGPTGHFLESAHLVLSPVTTFGLSFKARDYTANLMLKPQTPGFGLGILGFFRPHCVRGLVHPCCPPMVTLELKDIDQRCSISLHLNS